MENTEFPVNIDKKLSSLNKKQPENKKNQVNGKVHREYNYLVLKLNNESP